MLELRKGTAESDEGTKKEKQRRIQLGKTCLASVNSLKQGLRRERAKAVHKKGVPPDERKTKQTIFGALEKMSWKYAFSRVGLFLIFSVLLHAFPFGLGIVFCFLFHGCDLIRFLSFCFGRVVLAVVRAAMCRKRSENSFISYICDSDEITFMSWKWASRVRTELQSCCDVHSPQILYFWFARFMSEPQREYSAWQDCLFYLRLGVL